MRKIGLLIWAMIIALSSFAQTVKTTDKVTVKPTLNKSLVLNGTDKNTYFTVMLEGTNTSYTAYQMDIVIPPGMVVLTQPDGWAKVSLGTSSLREHPLYPSTVAIEENDDGEEIEVHTYSHFIKGIYNLFYINDLHVKW